MARIWVVELRDRYEDSTMWKAWEPYSMCSTRREARRRAKAWAKYTSSQYRVQEYERRGR